MSGCGIPPGGKIGIRHDSRSAHRFVGGPPVGCLRKFVVGDIPAYAAAWLQAGLESAQASTVRHDRADTIGRETRCSNSL
jgi:hypothetical protein